MQKDDEKKTAALGTVDAGTAPRAPMTLKLVVVAGPDEGRETPLEGAVDIGAEESCGLVLTDPAVSRRHARVTLEAGRVLVKDLGSRNGTLHGGVSIKEALVPVGAVLAIGKSAICVQPRWHRREVAPSMLRAFGELLGDSVAMREVFAVLERVAPSDVPLLVEGESGTGKELVARSLHAASARAAKPYVVFDCGAVPGELAESELFGHKKGAFSGATADSAGAFQRASGGTLCLDELGELPLDLQPKLLRVLETGEVRPVGEDLPRQMDVRIVASTNRDLHAEATRGRFRRDLLYRLDVVRIRMPPLRERPEDIPALVTRLVGDKLPPNDVITGENLRILMSYAWPGSVRELRNTLARAVTLAQQPGKPPPAFSSLVFNLGPGTAGPVTFGAQFPGIASPMPYKDAKAQLVCSFDRVYIAALLERHHDNVQLAAAAAGLSRKHLYELIRRIDAGEGDEHDDD